MGGHVAEKLFVGHEKVTTGCSSDLRGATNLAYEAVRRYGMFGEDAGYLSVDVKDVSQEHNALIDEQVKKILDVRLYHQNLLIFKIGIFCKSKGTSIKEGTRNQKPV